MITYTHSQELLHGLALPTCGSKSVPLAHAVGAILATDIFADAPHPLHPMAAMDGYALRYDPLIPRYRLIDHHCAGDAYLPHVGEGECVKTFTGARIPIGADTLIPIEYVRCEGDHILPTTSLSRGYAIRPRAENYDAGARLLERGRVLDFAAIGLLAQLGYAHISIRIPPRVALIATGSELLALGEPKSHDGQIYDTNLPTLSALVTHCGADVISQEILSDDPHTLHHALKHAMEHADVLITTGGVSVGDHDYVKELIPALGAEVIFHRVAIKPGQHLMLARTPNCVILALPGFAYSATVTFMLYGATLLARMGLAPLLYTRRARTRVALRRSGEKTTFKACRWEYIDGEYWIDLVGKQEGSSALLSNLLAPSALAWIEEESYEIGESLTLLMWDQNA